jgi:hypothetical protein
MAAPIHVYSETEREDLFRRCGSKLHVLRLSAQMKVGGLAAAIWAPKKVY